MAPPPIAYLAGPLVFFTDAGPRYQALKEACAEAGIRAVSPLDTKVELDDAPPLEQAARIRRANIATLHAADMVLADISPFRGPNADDGTAWELGFAEALGKIVVAYGDRPCPYPDAVESSPFGPLVTGAGGILLDGDGRVVEDFDLPCNLMLAAGPIPVQPSFDLAIIAALRAWRDQQA